MEFLVRPAVCDSILHHIDKIGLVVNYCRLHTIDGVYNMGWKQLAVEARFWSQYSLHLAMHVYIIYKQ